MNERPNIDRIRAELAAAIARLIDDRKLTDAAAGTHLGLSRDEVARLHAVDPGEFTIDYLVSLLNAFNQRVDMTVSPEAETAVVPPRNLEEQHSPVSNPLASIVQFVQELHKTIPLPEWERLPTDMAANHDHYLYGAPKRD